MGEAILVGGRMGAVEQKIYKWKQYQAVGTNTYYWNRYNVVSTTTYKWNKWNAVSTTNYTWNRYNATNIQREAYRMNVYYRREITNSNVWSSYRYTSDYKFYGAGTNYGLASNWVHNNAVNGKYMMSGTDYLINISSLSPGDDDRFVMYDNNFEYASKTITGLSNSIIIDSNEYSKGSLQGSVSSTNSSMYPSNGIHTDGYWYDAPTSSVSWSKGSTSYGQVTSSSSSAYPSNGVSGSYWYESAGSSTSYSKGSTKYSDVSSTNRSAYPDNNYSGSYWYVYSRYTTTWSQGDYVGDRLSTDRDRWPDNGRDGDYWYVFDGEA